MKHCTLLLNASTYTIPADIIYDWYAGKEFKCERYGRATVEMSKRLYQDGYTRLRFNTGKTSAFIDIGPEVVPVQYPYDVRNPLAAHLTEEVMRSWRR
mgnify:CR=1 FL=1